KEPMEVGPTTHYIMGGIRVDADTQMTTVAGLFAAGECAAGLHGANRLGGNSISDLLVFGKRAGEYAAKFAEGKGGARVDTVLIDTVAARALAPFGRPPSTGQGNPYQLQASLQETMQSLAGIVRKGSDLEEANEKINTLKQQAGTVSCSGNR